jgi:uncharacterized SAM-binding protein YcdF (DUF218 family)
MKTIRNILWLLAIVVCIIVAGPLFIGWYLSPQDVLEKVDAIVVVSGGDNNARISKGVQLYKEGWAPILMYSGAAAEGEVSNAEAMKNISAKMGVPKKNIVIEEESKTTVENAQFSAKIIKESGFKSVILVTSPYHQRRTYELFKKELPDVKIINQSALDENWRKKGWWQNNVGRFLTVGELSKIFIQYAQELKNNVR